MKDFRLIGIPELFGKRFFIPNYQRGYRWDIRQVNDLLEDIYRFYENAKDDEFYCLQPIIVASNDGLYEVIDGQQRLTTLYIILSYLNEARQLLMSDTSMFEIEYETRQDSAQYLKSINTATQIDHQNIDYFYMSQTYLHVKNWFEDNRINKGDFLNALLKDKKNVTLIWYEVEASPTEATELFTRINMWKIPLTNSELIKGIFFSSKNWDHNQEYYQLLTAIEWDRYEQALQKDEFWFFINKDRNITGTYTHMDLIFEIMADKYRDQVAIAVDKEIDTYYAFYILNELLVQKIKSFQELWDEVKIIYRMFDEWYNNHEYYHLVGFLTHSGASLSTILEKFAHLPKSEFKKALHIEIRNFFSGKRRPILSTDDLRGLSYMENSTDLLHVILLYNVITSMNSNNTSFPFNKYVNESWSLEHIHAQNSEMIRKNPMRISILKDQLDYLENNDAANPTIQKIQRLLDTQTDIGENEFELVQNEVFTMFGDDIGLHSIENLALLSRSDNSALNNNIFPIKREMIKLLDEKGSFIPICTKNVFQKYYSKDPESLIRWNHNDREDYYANIISTIGQLLFAEGDKNEC